MKCEGGQRFPNTYDGEHTTCPVCGRKLKLGRNGRVPHHNQQIAVTADEHIIAERDGYYVCIRHPEHGIGCTVTPTSTIEILDTVKALNRP